MPHWEHTLEMKDLLFDKDDLTEEQNYGHEVVKIAQTALERIQNFRKQVESKDEELAYALEEVEDAFRDVATMCADTDRDPEEEFNDALALLYDVGDFHRVWIK